ncbi:MAG: sulfotransferase [Gammaproteobacteria bacterium]|jgi:tetratricopeptide (TPR) repeat protein|nr:hypothetical protein [Chromatiales bacterium]MCP4926929.1 hypothetical protein [Gammaproteobacteria bacterium]MDP7419426.1 sulfotransferase [Gammaproteobacteria bacterium]
MIQKNDNNARTTTQDTIVSIDLGDSNGKQQHTFANVQQFIHDRIRATNFAQAASIAMQLAEQLPQDPWPHLVAAESLYLHQRIESALRYIDRALELDPQSIPSLVIKSRISLYSGKHDEAKQFIDTAIGIAPGNAQLQFEKGELLSEAGDLEGSRKALSKSIEINPRKTGSLLSLSRLPGDNFSAKLITQTEFFAQSHQLPAEDQVKIHYALANAYDKKANIDKHFFHLNAGSALKNRSLNYDPNTSRQEAQAVIDFFSDDFFKRRSNLQGNSANLIFIVGFPRCGSTLVEHIISSHPSVSSAGEIFALNHAVRHLQQIGNSSAIHPHWIDSLPDNILAELAENYLHRVEKFNKTSYLTDKLLNNYLHIGLIHLVFPNASIINVQRNPIDTCYSCYKNMFHLNSIPYSYTLENLADKYRDYQRVIRHWEKVLPGRIYTAEYEQLINQQEDVTRDILGHCGLTWNDACLEFQKNARTVLTNSSIQVRQPLYTNSINRWKTREKYLGPLLELIGNNAPPAQS